MKEGLGSIKEGRTSKLELPDFLKISLNTNVTATHYHLLKSVPAYLDIIAHLHPKYNKILVTSEGYDMISGLMQRWSWLRIRKLCG